TDTTRKLLRERFDDCLCPPCLHTFSKYAKPRVDLTAHDLLMIQFLRWVAERPRTYADVMEAWRTSCPRLSMWEDAQVDGLVRANGEAIELTERGEPLLDAAPPSDH